MHRTVLTAVLILSGSATLPAWADRGSVEHQGNYSVVFPYADARPNPQITPGAINPAVTQDTIGSTICRRGGYTRSVRPSSSYTNRLKRHQLRQYGYSDHRLRDYEEDHFIPLEVGGAPSDPRNLWPEPHHVIGGWGSYAKDRLENTLHRKICRHQMSLRDAQGIFRKDWIAGFQRYIGERPKDRD